MSGIAAYVAGARLGSDVLARNLCAAVTSVTGVRGVIRYHTFTSYQISSTELAGCIMGSKGQILDQYRTLSSQDQATFRRWLRLNVVVGSILTAGLVAMALVGSNADRSGTETAGTATSGKVAAYSQPTRVLHK